jgi:hypothetical protein
MTLKEKYYKKLDWNLLGTHQRKLDVSGDCVSIADDYAIEFAGYYEEILASGDYNLIDKDKKQLLEIFKKEKGL